MDGDGTDPPVIQTIPPPFLSFPFTVFAFSCSAGRRMSTTKSLRLVTYNVHGWLTADLRPNARLVVEYMKELKPDILCMQEVTGCKNTIEPLFLELGMDMGGLEHQKAADTAELWGRGHSGFFANTIWSRYPITFSDECTLGPDRKALFCTVDVDGTPFSVSCLHLDHIQEEERLREVKQLGLFIADKPPHILVGDFNSVRKEDYGRYAWEEIEKYRRTRMWEPPMTNVMDYVQNTLKYTSVLSPLNMPSLFSPGLASCRTGWTIDYALLSEGFVHESCGWRVKEAEIHHVPKAKAPSDHHPIIVDFEAIPSV
jgi:endonuclease/exonuclease/phosphatase family metal-dependent hydrolase